MRFVLWNIKSLCRAGSLLRWNFRKWDVGDMEWVELLQDKVGCRALVTDVMNLRFTYTEVHFLTRRTPDSFSKRTLLHGINYRVNCIRHYANFREAIISFVMAVCPSVPTE
jgi:hypothetical protein